MYRKNAWNKYDDKKVIMDFAEGYKEFLSFGKTERLVVKEAIVLLEDAGFKNINDVESLKAGDKVVLTAGVPLGIPGRTNMIRVEEI